MYVRKFLRRFFEGNDGEGSDLGGAPDSTDDTGQDDALADQGGETGDAGAAGKPDDDGPKTMLEAIEQGLGKKPEKKDDKAAEGDKQAPKKEASEQKKPGEPDDKVGEEDEPPPEGLSEKAKARFQALVGKVKTVSEQLDQAQTELHEVKQSSEVFQSFVRDTGVTGEQFGLMSQYLKALNSGDFQSAQNIIVSELKSLQAATGKELDLGDSMDPLSDYPDLKEAVDGYQITREYAMQLLQARRQQQAAQQQSQTTQQQEEYIAQWTQKKDTALAQVREWSAKLKKSDLDYAPIEKLIVAENGPLSQIMQSQAPEMWLNSIQLLYNQMKLARASIKPGSNGGSPRPMSGAGGMPSSSAAAPKSMFDAMWGGAR